jgi:ElaB/YqjD/DUF883 family membrane-anchored ribosome-binding protein
MSKHAPTIDIEALADEVRALIAATADVAGEKVTEARKRLTSALENGMERGREIYDGARDKAIEGTKAADAAVHNYPYQAITIGVGVGALIGFLVTCRCGRNRD